MSTAPAAGTRLAVRHVQLARAAFAAIAALMITFSPDHSAIVGLSVFSGFAIATGLIWGAAAWLVYPAGRRWLSVLMGALCIVAGMIGGLTTLRSTTLFFSVVIAWALLSGLAEGIAGWRALRHAQRADAAERSAARSEERDGFTVGVITAVLGLGLLIVPGQYVLDYYIPDADQTFTLTGITIAVGVFGAYAAIVAVYLGIAGFSPKREPSITTDAASTPRAEEGA
ncbi:MAG TPA: acyl-CoA synthetase [Microbacterium sp.]|uniref:acyl-CoA synthetase n=1 Tax=Microbacterium sp. TaxID=51671 RepID=UPI002BCE2BE2|nr:acyl-CoA synthetase [Microbacterium sp.]HWI31598.1 acyl-CoA synthetase [Microbacterium sp.]